MYKYLVALAVFASVATIYTIASWSMLKRKKARFATRVPLRTEELIALFKASSISLPTNDIDKVLEIIEQEVEIPRGLLRPEDRFDQELRPEKGWEFDDGIILLPLAIAKVFGGDIRDYDLACHPTIANLLQAVDSTRKPDDK